MPATVESEVSARTCATSGWQSLWPLPSLSTTAHSARRWQGAGERYELNYTAKSRKHLSPGEVPGHPVWVSRGGHRWRFCGTPWSTWLTSAPRCRFSTLLCRRRWNSWRISSRVWTLMFLSRLCKYPRSHKILSLSALWTSFRRWWNSCWKCRQS